jgi:hypothetical protein
MLRRSLTAVAIALSLSLTAGCSKESVVESALQLEQKIARLERKTMQLGDHEITYLEGGKGPAIVMLHGITADSGNWTRFARYYTANYRVVIPDLPGFGESSRLPERQLQHPRPERPCARNSRRRWVCSSFTWWAIPWAATLAPITPPNTRKMC